MNFFKRLVRIGLGFIGLVIAASSLLATYIYFSLPTINIEITNHTNQIIKHANIDCVGEGITSSVDMPLYLRHHDSKRIQLIAYDHGSGYSCTSHITREDERIITRKFGDFGLFTSHSHDLVIRENDATSTK